MAYNSSQLIIFSLFLTSCLCLAVKSFVGDEETGCPQVFERRCQCGLADYKAWNPDRKVYITNCTNSGFTNTTMLEYLPEETEVLIFTGNQLETLPWNLFGIFDERKKLAVLDLTNNGIKEIQGKSFHKVTTVKRLILDHNDLYVVSAMHHPRTFSNFENLEEIHLTNAFTEQIDSKWYLTDLKDIFGASHLLKLKKLHLEQNEIWEIKDNDMFCDLPQLMDLHLGDNQLTDINFSLDCLKQLRYLDLEYNKITNLGKETLHKLEKAFASKDRMIDLHGNPYQCDCHFMPFLDWMKQTKINLVNKDDMRCYVGNPEYNAGIKIENIEKLTCPAINTSNIAGNLKREMYESKHATTQTLLIILIALAVLLLAIILWTNRVTVIRKLKHVTENLNRHVDQQYAFIDEQEEEPREINV